MAEDAPTTPKEPPVSDEEATMSPRRLARRRLLEDIERHKSAILHERGGVPFDIEEIDALLAEVRGGNDRYCRD